jgi:hypothetical protein
MRMKRIRGCVVIFVAFLTLTSLPSARAVLAQKRSQTIIELWRTGDDGVTLRFADGFEADLQSAGFVLAPGGQARTANTLVVEIPTNLDFEPIGRRHRVRFRLEFAAPSGQAMGKSRGSCWEDELALCIKRAVAQTKTAAAKLHRRRSNKALQLTAR